MATNTKNFNFKKPDESDFYSIQDQNGNWDLADEELQKLNEPAFEDYTTGTSVPPAATALEALKSKIKLPVWMSNVVAFCKGCCTLAMIVNNCVSSDADKPLAAAQGKVLQDQLTKLYNNLSIGRIPNKVVYMSPNGEIDCNLLTDHFVLTKGKNFPPGEGFWYVQTIGYEIKPDGTVTVGKQIAWQYTGIKLFVRDCYNDVWDSWTEYITKSDLDKVAKIDRSTSSAWVGDNDNNMIFNCNFNNKTLTVTFTDGKTVIFQGK